MSNWDLSYCDCILLMIQDFQGKLGFICDGSKDSLNVLLFFCPGNLLFYSCLHSILYIFAVRHVNSVLNWMGKSNFGGHSNFRRTVIYAHQKIFGGHLKWLLGYLVVWMAAFWKFLLSCIRKLSRTLFAKSNFPLSNEDNQKKLFIKGKGSAMSAPKLELRVGPWRCVMWKVKWCSC